MSDLSRPAETAQYVAEWTNAEIRCESAPQTSAEANVRRFDRAAVDMEREAKAFDASSLRGEAYRDSARQLRQAAEEARARAAGQAAKQPFTASVSFTNNNPNTIWNKLALRLGREPTEQEAAAEVKRILSEC